MKGGRINGGGDDQRGAGQRITSRANALVRETRAVRDGKVEELIFVEGVRLCEEAVRSALKLEEVLYTDRLAHDERGAQLLAELSRTARRLSNVSEDVLASVSDTKTPQGVVALAVRPPTDRERLEKSLEENLKQQAPLLVVMHRAGNPANAGAMLRVAEAVGACGAILTEGSTDIFSPKALRGAMGSSFRLPVWAGAGFAEILRWCSARGIQTVSTDARASLTHTELDWRTPRAVVLGAEGGGLSDAETNATAQSIRIPMRAPVESLNVAVALAVVLYEAARQREQG